nr:PREDICTED: V-type proton ATPase subunit G 1 [Camelus bactrianus]
MGWLKTVFKVKISAILSPDAKRSQLTQPRGGHVTVGGTPGGGRRRRRRSWAAGSADPCIQQLPQAEKRAAEKVSEARKRKNRRLKQAKEEAQAEIEQYRLQREKEFKAKEAAALGSHGSCSTEVEKDTQEKMTILQTYFRQNRDEVLDKLLAFVCDIRPEIHENYRING